MVSKSHAYILLNNSDEIRSILRQLQKRNALLKLIIQIVSYGWETGLKF